MSTRLLLSLGLILAGILPALARTPIEVIHRLTDAIRKGDKAAIAPFYAPLKDKPLDLSSIASLESDLIAPAWCFESRTNHDAAVVIVGALKGHNMDLDPFYMIQLAGEWRVLPRHTDIEVARATVSDSTMKALEGLADWFEPRKSSLRDELRTELQAAWKKPNSPTLEEAREHTIEILSKRDPGHPKPPPAAQLPQGALFTATQLIGQWRHVDVKRKLVTTLTFKGDGTYTGQVELNGTTNGSFSGKWTLQGSNLNYLYTASSDKNIPVGSKDQDKIVELTKDQYTIENTLGTSETYIRVQ
jgi:hypothetical protein